MKNLFITVHAIHQENIRTYTVCIRFLWLGYLLWKSGDWANHYSLTIVAKYASIQNTKKYDSICKQLNASQALANQLKMIVITEDLVL